MTKPNRLGAALTAASLMAIVTACAGPGSSGTKSASIFGGKVESSNIALATRAQVALTSNDLQNAVSLAERAVERSPNDAGFRALLGNCYLASGRFASAEAAYRDSLSLVGTQPQVVLKLALVQISQGKTEDAKALLAAAQGLLDPADTGLALALAGDPHSAISVLEPAARAIGADATVRQNLALAYALAGNWDQARVVAGQDVPADQLDGRIQQWMALAKPARQSDQVAAFIGIRPVASDPGQPVRLALNKVENVRHAAAEAVTPQPEQVIVAEVQPAPAYEAPAMVAEVQPATVYEAPVMTATGPAPSIEPVALPAAVAAAAEPAPLVADYAAAPASPIRQARPALSPAAVRLSDSLPSIRRAALPKATQGKSRAVVQLGAYSARDRIELAWNKASAKFSSLRGYTPVSARFDTGKGTVYRLSVKGFASDRDAIQLCSSLKRQGRACFVRAVSNDTPVRFASR